MNGALVIHKPAGLTSHDVVNRVRRILHERSVGHLGTLDPFATGVLPLMIGTFTRLSQFYRGAEKTYEGAIRFGFATNTYDCDGEKVGNTRLVTLSLAELRELSRSFVGTIEQVPPPFSAKKIGGVRAYRLARNDREVKLEPVTVEIKEFEILSANANLATFRVRVGAGTYMRSVAHDMGQRLGCGAHLESLCRTSVAEFDIADAHTLEELQFGADEAFIHPRRLLPDLPSVTADSETTLKIRSGRAINLPEFSAARLVKVFCGQTELTAIAARVAGTLFHPKIVLVANRVETT